jgi:glycosyltransferase involved in cell wall biosynthesis
MNKPYTFPDVTLLITHYNRSSSLERLLLTFHALNCRFGEIIVSDDASKPEHLEKMKNLQGVYDFRLLTVPENKGLGHNLNKGQDAVKTKYTLYVQEDFVPTSIFPVHFHDALKFMNEDSTLDYIRFWALADSYPHLKPYGKGFSQMKFSPRSMNHLKFYQYSDTPHIRRSNFFEKFGRYKEGIYGDLMDYKMAISFLQKKGKGLFFDAYSTLFSHENSTDEPSTMRPLIHWRQKRNIYIDSLRFIYLKFRVIKNTLDIKLMK